MVKTTLPKMNMETAETGCCPRFDPGPWDDEEFQFQDRLFVRARTVNFLHIPLNIGSIIKKTWAKIQAADAAASDEYLDALHRRFSLGAGNTISRSPRMFLTRRWSRCPGRF